MIKYISIFILLKATMKELLPRIFKDEKANIYRPIINYYEQVNHFEKCRKYADFQREMIEYSQAYEEIADLKLSTDDKSPSIVAKNVIDILQQRKLIRESL